MEREVLVGEDCRFIDENGADHTDVIRDKGWVVVNAPRPLLGDLTWVGDFRHGIFYAAGDWREYEEEWEAADAWPVRVLNNQLVEDLLKEKAEEFGIPWETALETFGSVGDMAQEYGFPWKEREA